MKPQPFDEAHGQDLYSGGPRRQLSLSGMTQELFQNRPESSIPFRARRIGFEIADAGEVQVIKLLAGARQFAALANQGARLGPLLMMERGKDMFVEGDQGAEFWRGAHHRIAQQGE